MALIDTGEVDAAGAALRKMLNDAGYGSFVSDTVVHSAAVQIVTAIEHYKAAQRQPSQGQVSIPVGAGVSLQGGGFRTTSGGGGGGGGGKP
jgi:hypothetical protein